MSVRTHGNKRLPHNTLPQAVAEDVKNFLSNYIDENAVLLPGRIPGCKNDDIKLLSSCDTKMSTWKTFKRTCEDLNKQAVCYTKFIELWKQFHLNVIVAKPMMDLCFTCQENTSKLLQAANLPEAEKSECIQAQQQHLNSVQSERELYRKVCEEAKCTFEMMEDQINLAEHHEACSLPTTMHYSFDFAQQIHIPSNPMQPGPIYFKTPRKCAIFGVMCQMEALLGDRDTYLPVDKSPFAKIEKELNNRLLDLKRQNKIDDLLYRKLRSTYGSRLPSAVPLNITNQASLFDRLFLPLALPSITHLSSSPIFYCRFRTLMDILFLIPRSLPKKWLIWKFQRTRLWFHLMLCRFSQLSQ